MKREEKACQGCDHIEAPVLDDGTKYFAERLYKKHQREEDQVKTPQDSRPQNLRIFELK